MSTVTPLVGVLNTKYLHTQNVQYTDTGSGYILKCKYTAFLLCSLSDVTNHLIVQIAPIALALPEITNPAPQKGSIDIMFCHPMKMPFRTKQSADAGEARIGIPLDSSRIPRREEEGLFVIIHGKPRDGIEFGGGIGGDIRV